MRSASTQAGLRGRAARAARIRASGAKSSRQVTAARANAQGGFGACRCSAAMWASRAKGRLSQGASKSRHSARFQAALRNSSSGSPPSRSARQARRARARDRAGEGADRRLLDPTAEDAGEDAQGVGLRQFLEDRIDARLHRAAAQQLRAEGVDGADEGAVQAARRFGEALRGRRDRARAARRRSSSWRTRSFMLPAAAWVKVTATMVSTGVPAAMTSTMRSTSAVVLPVPAEASTTQLRSRSETALGVMPGLRGWRCSTSPCLRRSPSERSSARGLRLFAARAPLRRGRRRAGTRSSCSRPCAARRGGSR